ncbi:hypothetical protein ZTR_06222 [Talaromyces verruculosus]|nr:hypothetical protein ZTR_06222 [Talaromyces verruculosus]
MAETSHQVAVANGHENDDNNDHLIQSSDPQHPANLIPEMCRKFYTWGWVTGTGGGTSIRHGDHIYIAPSGVQKELIQPENMFVMQFPTPKYPPSERKYIRKPKNLKPSDCTPLFLTAFERGAGCCIHTHSQWAVLVTLLVERDYGKEGYFEISNIEQIKGIPKGKGKGMHNYHDTLRIPIIENTPFEEDLTEGLERAINANPDTYAVLVRRHGIYVWGDTPAKAKTQFWLRFELAMDLDGGESPWGDEPSTSTRPTESPTAATTTTQTTTHQPLAVPQSPARRGPRTSRKVSAQVTKLEAVDDTSDPLGPLGESTITEEAPIPPLKETVGARVAQPAYSAAQSSAGAPVDRSEEQQRTVNPPPVQFPGTEAAQKRQTQPSISIEQAAKPTFNITVGDPHKVGDLTSSHIVYQIRTKTTSKAYRRSEFEVSRRYRDFLWIYNQLHNNNPGVVVPPPPEKQAVGRFDTNFVESRRAALERMINKIAAHPILQHDADLKIFLESETFGMDVKNKENREPDLGQSKGMFSSLGISVGGGGKFIEHDDWFHDRKVYLDALENQLKALMKAIDTVVAQRKGLAEAAGDFSASLHALAAVELSPVLSGPLEGLSELQLRIRELYERQAQQDVLTLGITIDEYIRLIGSIKTAFSQRQKSFHSWHAAEAELQKRRHTQEKLLRQGKSQQDRINQINADVADAERKVHQSRLLFEDMGRLMRNELERFEKEKVEDFKSGVETFLEGAVEAQKELIELWESFLLQLDAGEEGNPLYPPQPENHGEEPAAAVESNNESATDAEEARAAAVAAAVAAEETH